MWAEPAAQERVTIKVTKMKTQKKMGQQVNQFKKDSLCIRLRHTMIEPLKLVSRSSIQRTKETVST